MFSSGAVKVQTGIQLRCCCWKSLQCNWIHPNCKTLSVQTLGYSSSCHPWHKHWWLERWLWSDVTMSTCTPSAPNKDSKEKKHKLNKYFCMCTTNRAETRPCELLWSAAPHGACFCPPACVRFLLLHSVWAARAGLFLISASQLIDWSSFWSIIFLCLVCFESSVVCTLRHDWSNL